MSLQVNLAGRDILQAYQDVLNARDIDWALFSYEKGSNDLKVQSTGNGGLEELEEEFSDGRCVIDRENTSMQPDRVDHPECNTRLPVSKIQTYAILPLRRDELLTLDFIELSSEVRTN